MQELQFVVYETVPSGSRPLVDVSIGPSYAPSERICHEAHLQNLRLRSRLGQGIVPPRMAAWYWDFLEMDAAGFLLDDIPLSREAQANMARVRESLRLLFENGQLHSSAEGEHR